MELLIQTYEYALKLYRKLHRRFKSKYAKFLQEAETSHISCLDCINCARIIVGRAAIISIKEQYIGEQARKFTIYQTFNVPDGSIDR